MTKLVRRVKTAFKLFCRDTVGVACGRFRSRLEAVADAEDSYLVRWRLQDAGCDRILN